MFDKTMTEKQVREFFKESTEEQLQKEVEKILSEMKYGPHADSPEYANMANELRKLIEIQNDKKPDKSAIDLNNLLPILIKAGLSSAVLLFWVAVEQERPLPLRVVQWTSSLLMPR